MTTNIFKRSISFLLVLIMAVATTSTAFAKENQATGLTDEDYTEVSEYILNVSDTGEITLVAEDSEIIPFDNSPVRGVVPSNGYIDLNPTLESYIGFNKNFVVNATSNSTSGALFVYLYKPNGNLQSNDWIMGVNEVVKWSVFLPSSGTWRVRFVAQGTTAPVNVYARWEWTTLFNKKRSIKNWLVSQSSIGGNVLNYIPIF